MNQSVPLSCPVHLVLYDIYSIYLFFMFPFSSVLAASANARFSQAASANTSFSQAAFT